MKDNYFIKNPETHHPIFFTIIDGREAVSANSGNLNQTHQNAKRP